MNISRTSLSRGTITSRGAVTLPGAIIIAGTIIALAVIWTQRPTDDTPRVPTAPVADPGAVNMAPVSASDHILGNPDAPVKIVEYSDPSCPYCKIFHSTMTQLMDEYGPSGQVAWVYRQFPLDKPAADGRILHPNAGRQAHAFECAAYMGGNTAFFEYVERWFELFPEDGGNRTKEADDVDIFQAAADTGLAESAFRACLDSGRFDQKLQRDYTAGINAGVTGTPYIVLMTPSGGRVPLAGVVSYSALKTSIDTLLSDLPPTTTTTTP